MLKSCYLQSNNNNMIKIILVIILILQTALAQEYLSNPLFYSEINKYDEVISCYLQQNVIKGSLIMVLQISDFYYYWTSSSNMTTPQQAFEIYQQPAHVLISTEPRIDHSLYGELVARALRDQPIKAVWVLVTNNCIQSCDELKGFLRDIRKIVGPEVTIGIYTGPEYWSNTFDERGCPEVPQEYPLFYSSHYFKDFRPFAGWKKAEYIHSSSVTVPGCKVIGELNQISYYTKPNQ